MLLLVLQVDIEPHMLAPPEHPQTPASVAVAPTHEPAAPVGQSASVRQEIVPAVRPTQIVSLVPFVTENVLSSVSHDNVCVAKKVTVQLPVMAPVVYVEPFQEPVAQVPVTTLEMAYPESGVTSKACVPPEVTLCGVEGETVTLSPPGVTVYEGLDPPPQLDSKRTAVASTANNIV